MAHAANPPTVIIPTLNVPNAHWLSFGRRGKVGCHPVMACADLCVCDPCCDVLSVPKKFSSEMSLSNPATYCPRLFCI